jgi:hypothetical protein
VWIVPKYEIVITVRKSFNWLEPFQSCSDVVSHTSGRRQLYVFNNNNNNATIVREWFIMFHTDRHNTSNDIKNVFQNRKYPLFYLNQFIHRLHISNWMKTEFFVVLYVLRKEYNVKKRASITDYYWTLDNINHIIKMECHWYKQRREMKKVIIQKVAPFFQYYHT